MNNNTIANITVDELHEYVTIMASKIAKMTVEENSVVTGTIIASAGNNYTIQLKTSDSQSNARPLTDEAVYNVGDYVYLIRGAAAIEGGESQSYFIFGRVDDTNEAFANASDLERFTGQDEYTLTSSSPSSSSSVTFERGSNEDEPIFWTRLKNYKALKIEGNFTTVDNVGVTVTYNYADGTKEEFKLDAAWMQGQPNNMNSLYQARVIERTKALIDGDTVTVSMVGSTSVTLTAGTLNKYLKDFSLEVKPTNKSYFRNELPEKVGEDTVRLEAKLKYLDGAINSGVQYYWFVEMPEGVTEAVLDDEDKAQVNDLIGGDRWYCLNDYDDCSVVGQDKKIRIWNKSDNFILLDKFKYLLEDSNPKVFYFDKSEKIPFKFVNKIKCVAVYEGFYINSEILELVDYAKEQYSVSLKASEIEPHNIVSKEDFVEFECIVTNDNPYSGGLTPAYYWYVVNSQAKNADFNLTFDDTKQYYLYNTESDTYYEKTTETYDASVTYYKIDSENPDAYLECTPDDFQIAGFKQDKTYFIKISVTADDGSVYEEFQQVAAGAVYDSSITYYTGSLINSTDNTKNILRVHGGIENEKMINYKVDHTALYMFYCVVEFISKSVTQFMERTSPVKATSYLGNTLVFTESYQYYISQNPGVTFNPTNNLKKDVWTISDSGVEDDEDASWTDIDNKEAIATKFEVFNGKRTVNDDGSLARWHLYYTYQQTTTVEGSDEIIDSTEWSRPIILRIVEYRNGAWTDIRSSTEVNQLNTFNALTNNGQKEGLHYTDINEYIITSDTTAVKDKAYYLKEEYVLADNSYFKLGFKDEIDYYQVVNNTFTKVEKSKGWVQGVVYYKENDDNDKVKCEAADFNRIDFLNSNIEYWTYPDGEYKQVTEFVPGTEYYVKGVSYRPIVVEEGTSLATQTYYEKTDSKSHLYINATYINTGTLSVGQGANEKFYASIHNPEVRIAGFTVDVDSISNEKSGDERLYFGKEGLQLGTALNTTIDENGKASVTISGDITVTNGTNADGTLSGVFADLKKQISEVDANKIMIDTVTEYYVINAVSELPAPDEWQNDKINFNFTTEIQTPTEEKPYLWNYEVTTYTGKEEVDSTIPVIIAYYTEDGKDGWSIDTITNWYAVSETEKAPGYGTGGTQSNPTENWTQDPSKAILSSETSYLWNYEVITYSGGEGTKDPTITQPALIGSRGEDGTIEITQADTIAYYYEGSTSEPSTPADQNGSQDGWETEENFFPTWYGSTTSDGKRSVTYVWKTLATKIGNDIIFSTSAVRLSDMEAIELAAKWQIISGKAIRQTNGTWKFPEVISYTGESVPSGYTSILAPVIGESTTDKDLIPEGDIGRWCYLYDRTIISGGAIVSGSITADNIAANAIKAGHIEVDNLQAISGNMGTLTAGKIQSQNYIQDQSGFQLSCDENEKMIDSKGFKVTQNGEVTAISGTIANWNINEKTLESNFNNSGISGTIWLQTGDTDTEGAEVGLFVTQPEAEGATETGWKTVFLSIDDFDLIEVSESSFIDPFYGPYFIYSIYIEPKGEYKDYVCAENIRVQDGIYYYIGDDSAQMTEDIVFQKGVSGFLFFLKGADQLSGIDLNSIVTDKIEYRTRTPLINVTSVTGDGHLRGEVVETKTIKDLNHEICLDLGTTANPLASAYFYAWVLLNDNDGYPGSEGGYTWNFALYTDETKTVFFDTTILAEDISLLVQLDHTDTNNSANDKGKRCVPITFTRTEDPLFTITYPDFGGALKEFSIQTVQTVKNPDNPWQKVDQLAHGRAEWGIWLDNHFVIQEALLEKTIESFRSLIPNSKNKVNLGSRGSPWQNIYTNSLNGTNILATTLNSTNTYAASESGTSSDLNRKHDIAPLSTQYGQLFDSLQPVTYKYNDGTSDRTHTGFIAQDVLAAMQSSGLSTQDFAGYIERTQDDGEITRYLRYGEFIALCVDQIQKLKSQVNLLEEKLNQLEKDKT